MRTNTPFKKAISRLSAVAVYLAAHTANVSGQSALDRFAPNANSGVGVVVVPALSQTPILLNTTPTFTPVSTPTPGCVDDTWTATSLTNAPSSRHGHTAVWTGTEMIVWGGYDLSNYLNTGGRYNPETNTWTPTSVINAPTGRWFHTAVWTGSEMIIWGGAGQNAYFDTGGKYDPITDTWTPMSRTGTPVGRREHRAVWTGNEMIVWGGAGIGASNTGGKYNPSADRWVPTTTTNAPSGRQLFTAIWTGKEMIVWGGAPDDGVDANTGGKYNPVTDSWIPTAIDKAPSPRRTHAAVWTGNRMIVWGGFGDDIDYSATGGIYDPVTDTWTPTSIANAPTARSNHVALWTGNEMIIWGGGTWTGILNTGARYNPVTDTWILTSATNAPTARDFRASRFVWTGNAMIVWGGGPFGGPQVLNTGGKYCTPSSPITISGAISYCPKPVPVPVSNVTLSLTGSASGTILSDSSGHYQFSSLFTGGSYAVTPVKSPLAPGSAGIDTVDVIAAQRHFLGIGLIPPGCTHTAADVTGDGMINSLDVIAIQRFSIGGLTGIGNVGKYQFAPASRAYSVIPSDQTDQNYDVLIFGDIVSPFVE